MIYLKYNEFVGRRGSEMKSSKLKVYGKEKSHTAENGRTLRVES